jgi:phage shock protein PspC (stress-responsive transcriptional regulator)
MEKKLYRDEYRKKIAGVCAGLAEYLGMDVGLVRVLFVLMLIFHGGGLLIYIVFWIALPKKPYIYNDPTVDYTVPPKPGDQTADPYTNNPYTNNPWGGNPYQGNPFGNNPTPPPYPQQPRSTSLLAIIFGVILIVVGGSILLDNFDIIPDWDVEHLWPIIIIAVGCVLMLAGEKKKPWEGDWNKNDTDKNKQDTDTDTTAGSNPPTEGPADNPPAA